MVKKKFLLLKKQAISIFIKILKIFKVMFYDISELKASSNKLTLSYTKRPRSEPFEEQEFLDAMKKNTHFFLIKNINAQTILCALDIYNTKIEFIKNLLLVAQDNHFSVYIKNNKKYEAQNNIRKIYLNIINKKIIDFQFKDFRSETTLYFQIQFWTYNENYILAPSANDISMKVWKDTIDKYQLFNSEKLCYLADILDKPHQNLCSFDVDIVYTWVNADDKDWQKLYCDFKDDIITDGNSLSRYHNRDELKYSLRSLDMYAPWIRKIFIVSNCAPPKWLNLEHEKIRWVYHEEIFSKENLPTFSSHAIECNLHKIKDLSNFFVYFNDDLLLVRPTSKHNFFMSNGLCKIKFEPYGNVNGDINAQHPDYLNAARNGQKLIEQEFNKSPSQLHTHSPQALRKDTLEEMALTFKHDFTKTSSHKFRTIQDISVTSFLFHHFAYCKALAVKDTTKTMLIQQKHSYTTRFNTILKEKNSLNISNRYFSICINDGANSHENENWNIAVENFLAKYFVKPSIFEKIDYY